MRSCRVKGGSGVPGDKSREGVQQVVLRFVKIPCKLLWLVFCNLFYLLDGQEESLLMSQPVEANILQVLNADSADVLYSCVPLLD